MTETNFVQGVHYNADFESAVLGVCMIEKEAFARTYGIIDGDSFYHDANRYVYYALSEMYSSGIPIDPLTVSDYLRNAHAHEELGGYNTDFYVTKLTNSVVSSAHVEYHSYVIKRMWMERELMKLTHGAVKMEGNVKEKIYQISTAIQAINQGNMVKEWTDMSELIFGLMMHQDEMTKTGGRGMTTGLDILDNMNGGFFPGQMIVIGARPSVGKSAFAGQIALAIAKTKVTVGFISLEMNNNEIAARLSALETNENFGNIYRNLYRDENHRVDWFNMVREFIDLKIFVSDKTNVNAIDIKAKATKLKHAEGLGCLVIDYLQLIDSDGNGRNKTRENEVSMISRTCKLMAKELNMPVIVLCQLNRASTQRSDKNRYPQLSDLRESGSIEQDADIVMFLHRDWTLGEGYMVDENQQSTEDQADLIVRKWRNGTSNLHVPMHFDGPKMRFTVREQQTQQKSNWKPQETRYNDQNPF